MSRLRTSLIFRPVSAARSTPCPFLPLRPLQQKRHAGQDYGSGQGDPKGENPQDQGSNPSADLEHPGPPPPSVGQGTGGGPTKAHDRGHNSQQKTPSGGGSSGGSGSDAKPKIHDSKVPTEESEEVRKHNEDMEKRHGRSYNQINDDGKVEK